MPHTSRVWEPALQVEALGAVLRPSEVGMTGCPQALQSRWAGAALVGVLFAVPALLVRWPSVV